MWADVMIIVCLKRGLRHRDRGSCQLYYVYGIPFLNIVAPAHPRLILPLLMKDCVGHFVISAGKKRPAGAYFSATGNARSLGLEKKGLMRVIVDAVMGLDPSCRGCDT